MAGMANVQGTEAPSPARGSFITPGFRWGFALVCSLFFLWAVANNFNDILIRQFQKSLGLNRAQAGIIQFVFYIGYFTVALPAGLVMRRFGYKAGILVGLGLYTLGALLFLPASIGRTFEMFLFALFLIASGAAFLETAANPYMLAFGDPSRASQRLNFAQAFNGFGGFLAPIIGGLFIFSGIEHSTGALAAMTAAQRDAYRIAEAHTVQGPYLVLAAAAALIAIAVALTRLPETRTETASEPLGPQFRTLLAQPALRGAIVAQFFYVGAQVGIWSFFVDFVKDATPATPERTAAYLLSASLVMFMVGRFVGTAIMTRMPPTRLLALYAAINVVLCLVATVVPGMAGVVALMLTSFFMSIMFPTIFAIGVKDLGPLMPLGASLVVMAIIGGAVFPPAMGLIATKAGSMHPAMVLPALCFVFVAVYAWRTGRAWAGGAGQAGR
ncbi:MAG TPA: L-fucose:H+ symporter permease [Sphingomonas sp.]|jgi:FHS family L-fucose permease-like MFS transporter|nr:L-fucose:H+ symporter permease [Sphingomonas sp.]